MTCNVNIKTKKVTDSSILCQYVDSKSQHSVLLFQSFDCLPLSEMYHFNVIDYGMNIGKHGSQLFGLTIVHLNNLPRLFWKKGTAFC